MLIRWIVAGIVGSIATMMIRILLRQQRLRRIMPPGPAGIPFLGNILQLPQHQWLKFAEWKETYGPIFSLNLAGTPVVVINDVQTATDLLDRRSGIYSDRPTWIMTGILTQGLALPSVRYGDRWRRMRRAAHEGFSARGSVTYQGVKLDESAMLLSRLLHSSGNWDATIRRSIGVIVLGSLYDWSPQDNQTDSLIERIDEFMDRLLKAALPGAALVETFPWLLHLPDWIATWKRKALDQFKTDKRMFEELIEGVKNRMETSHSGSSFSAKLISDQEKLNLSAEETAWLAGMIFGAAVDTTSSTLSMFVLAMVLYPDVMRRAQAEIDAVVGRERMPTFEDRPSLPYVEALIRETSRWGSPAPLSLPRSTTQDDLYNGYHIPKDTLVVLNVWAINHDTTYFPDHDVFRPNRYFNSSGNLIDVIPESRGYGHFTFGTGRRICVGKDFATQTLYIIIARMLWAFNIERATDVDGRPVIPSATDVVDIGLLVRPTNFPCKITPRSETAPSIIKAAVEDAVAR